MNIYTQIILIIVGTTSGFILFCYLAGAFMFSDWLFFKGFDKVINKATIVLFIVYLIYVTLVTLSFYQDKL